MCRSRRCAAAHRACHQVGEILRSGGEADLPIQHGLADEGEHRALRYFSSGDHWLDQWEK